MSVMEMSHRGKEFIGIAAKVLWAALPAGGRDGSWQPVSCRLSAACGE